MNRMLLLNKTVKWREFANPIKGFVDWKEFAKDPVEKEVACNECVTPKSCLELKKRVDVWHRICF